MTNQTKSATLEDVAKLAGVSAKTVSRVINANDYVSEKTQLAVEDAVNKLGYRPNRAARSLVSDKTMVIGLILPEISGQYFSKVIAGIEQVANENQYTVLLLNSGCDEDRERSAFRVLEEHRVDGLIVNTPRLPDQELISLIERQKACVVIGHDPISDQVNTVNIDVRSAMVEAVKHLTESGCRNIAYFGTALSDVYPHQQRMLGIEDAYEQLNLATKPNYILKENDSDENASEIIVRHLRENPHIDAIIAYNDEAALSVIEACDRLGLIIPKDIAVIGFDDVSYAQLQRISLTTFHIPRFDVGVVAAQMLFDRIGGESETQEIMFKPDFVIRSTTTG